MRLLGIIALLLLPLAGCSDSNDQLSSTDSPAAEDTSLDLPACAEVWVAGETLPEDYEGCLNEDDSLEVAAYFDCADGSKLTSYQDRWWAIAGEEIHDAPEGTASNAEYADAYDACA